MAYKKPSKGEPPLGLGGDTFETGAIKLFDNTAELFTKLGANVDGDGVLPDAIPIEVGGTGATTVEGAKQSLGLQRFAQGEDVTSIYAPYTPVGDSRIVITKTGWGVRSSNPNFDTALSLSSGGTGASTKEQARVSLGTAARGVLVGPDFNTLRESGLFFIKPGGGSNFPSLYWGYLTVISGTEGVLNTIQKYTPDTAPHVSYVRQAIGTTWSSWTVFRSIPDGVGVGLTSDLRGIGTPNPTALIGYGLRFGLMSQAQIGAHNSTWYAGLILNAHNDTSATGANPYILGFGAGQVFLKTPTDYGDAWLRTTTMLSDYNTVKDGNGFIKGASPVVDLYADRIEANDQAKWQDVSFEKLGIGDYLIKGSLGFAQTSWYVEQPKDANGNVFHAVVYDTLDNGDLSIKTYERKLEGVNIVADLTKPVDIKENRFISIRLHEEQEGTTAPINPAITDNEGNAAPTRYHTLEEGVWIISEEDAAKLEQERLAAMQPLKRRQFRLTLAMNGYDLAEIESLINQIEDPMQRTIAQIEWQDATDVERTNSTLLMMTQLLGLSSEDVDSLWEYGLAL